MYVINEQTLDLKELNILMKILKQYHLNKDNQKEIISYQDFSKLVKLTVEEIMKVFLQKINETDALYSCQIKKMKLSISGEFIWKENQIFLNKDVIKKLYSNNILSMLTILHELNHFLIKYEILNGKISSDLIRILKEQLLTSLGMKKHSSSIVSSFFDVDASFATYYEDNYSLDSEEKIANIHAIYDFIILADHFDITLSKEETNQLKELLFQNKIAYQNHIRDVRNNTNFNSYFIDFEEAFDIMLRYHHPEWFSECPQLRIEYYLDETNHIKKRTKDQLLQLLETETNSDKQDYIETLCKGNPNKILDKTVFTENNYDILSKTYSVKKKGKQKNIYKEIKLFS